MARQSINIIRISPFSGKTNSMVMSIDPEDIECYEDGELVQDAFPYLTADEREFFKTGITPEEWNEMVVGLSK